MKPARLIAAFVGAIALVVAFAVAASGQLAPATVPQGIGSVALSAFGSTQSDLAVAAVAKEASATAMVKTQRMTEPTLNSKQEGWYAKGQRLTLTCFKRGQAVKGYFSPSFPGGWDNLWYRVSDGFFVADVDIDTGSNATVTGECGVATDAPAAIDTNQWYRVTNVNSKLVVDLAGGASKDGTAVQQYESNGTKAQWFRFIPTTDGYYQVVSALSGTQAWDVKDRVAKSGGLMQVWKFGNGTNQQWKPLVSGAGVKFVPRHATKQCLDVPGASKKVVRLQIYECNGTGAQQFTLTALGYVTAPKPGARGDTYPADLKAVKIDTKVDPWNFWNRNCTSFVAWRLNEVNKVKDGPFTNQWKQGNSRWGNASQWKAAAIRAGVKVDKTPKAGAVAWWSSNHVAWVAQVNSDGTVVLEEYNYGFTGNYHKRTVKASTVEAFLHIQDL